MTPQERQLVDDLFDRLSKMESAPRDPDAAAAIAQGLRVAPRTRFIRWCRRCWCRTKRCDAPTTASSNWRDNSKARRSRVKAAASSIRCAAPSSASQSQGSVPNVRPPEVGSRPGLEQRPSAATVGTHYDQGGYGQTLWRLAQAPMGGGHDGWWPDGRRMMGGERRRFVSGNRGGGSRRRCWRFASAQQHPRHDGRRPSRLWRQRARRPCRQPKSMDRPVQQQPRPRRRRQRYRLERSRRAGSRPGYRSGSRR